MGRRLLRSSLAGGSLAIALTALTAEAARPVSALESPESAIVTAMEPMQIAQLQIAQLQIAQSNGVSVSGSNGTFTGQVLVRTSAQTAWNVLTDYNRFSSFIPSVAESRVLQSNGNRKVFEQVNVIRVLAFTRRSRVVISSVESYPQQISFSLVEGDVESLQGVWRIQPRGNNQVLITHQVTVDPGSSPTRGLFFNIYRSTLANTLSALKQEMERRGS